MDSSVTPVYEELRLATLANKSDTTPFSTRVLEGSGLETLIPQLAQSLCAADETTTLTNFDAALTAVTAAGQGLWRAAVDRAQGRGTAPTGSAMPIEDDRLLYWARLQMTKTLRQWKPGFGLSADQMTQLEWALERAARGQNDIAFPSGNLPWGRPYRHLVISGFDPFGFFPASVSVDNNVKLGNPSGAAALALDGTELTLSDGSVLHIEAYMLPVDYDPFNKGMQEDTIGPLYQAKMIDASISISQGGYTDAFALEQWNGRYHGVYADNANMTYCFETNYLPKFVAPTNSKNHPQITLPGSGCDIYPPMTWLGYDSLTEWIQNSPAQFTTTSLPLSVITAAYPKSLVKPDPKKTIYKAIVNKAYSYLMNCNDYNSMNFSAMAPVGTYCALTGTGGNFLSNESAYRNTLMRDVFNAVIPAGHIHTPIATFVTAANALTDSQFEASRISIVNQIKAILLLVGNTLTN